MRGGDRAGAQAEITAIARSRGGAPRHVEPHDGARIIAMGRARALRNEGNESVTVFDGRSHVVEVHRLVRTDHRIHRRTPAQTARAAPEAPSIINASDAE